MGVRIVEGTRVTGFRLQGNRVIAVGTERRPVQCDAVE